MKNESQRARNARLWCAWCLERAAMQKSPFGGISFNDAWNLEHFGATRAELLELSRRAQQVNGSCWTESTRKDLGL
jgi:hypothetical protein